MKKYCAVLVMVSICLVFTLELHAAPRIYMKGTTTNKTNAYNGYTLYLSNKQNKILLIDMLGHVVNSWHSRFGTNTHIGSMFRPLPNGNIITFENIFHGEQKCIVEQDQNGNVVWSFINPAFYYLHHDFQRKSNGNTLILGSISTSYPSIALYEIMDDIIIEVNQSGEKIWSWSTAEHYDQLALNDESRKMIRERNMYNYVDERILFHTNSIQELPDNQYWRAGDARFQPGNILVSQRNTNIVFIIDKETGRILWQIKRTVGQHHATMIDDGLPGAGNILIFDNGGPAGFPMQFRMYSQVIEVNPVKKEIVWNYDGSMSGSQKRAFYNPYMGGAQRLPNGNTLITESEWGRIFEVSPNGNIVWEYINPDVLPNGSNQFYRSYRVPPEWFRLGS